MFQWLLDRMFGLERVSFREWGSLRLSFAVDWPGAIIFLVCLVLLGLGYWSYRRQTTTPFKRRAMGIIRGLVLVLVFLLLCRPQLEVDFEQRTPSVVAIWVDNSASSTIEDPYKDQAMKDLVKQVTGQEKLEGEQTRASRYHLALDGLARGKWVPAVAKTQTVMFFTGSTGVDRPVGTVEPLAEGQDPAAKVKEVEAIVGQLKKIRRQDFGDATDVPTVARDIQDYVSRNGGRLSSIVLLTDGQTTQGTPVDLAAATAARSGTKIFAIPLGQAEAPLNLKISTPQIPENTFVRDPVAVKAKLEWSGVDRNAAVKVSLIRQEAGQPDVELVSKEVPVDPGFGSKDVELIFKPEKKSDQEKSEKFNLVIKVAPVGSIGGDELTMKDNSATGGLNVLDAEINVLYVEGYPRWEYRYLKNELIREKSINVSCILLSADENFAQEGDPRKVDKEGREIFPGPVTRFPETMEEMQKFDVIIIGDIEPQFFSPTQMKLLVEHVRKNGAGVAWIGGPAHNPDSYKGTPLDVLLPVVADDASAPSLARSANEPFNLVLTAEGKQSNLFRFFDDAEANVKQIADLPEFYYFKPVVGKKPAAEVLAVHPTRSQGGEPAPLLVTGRYGEGRVLYSGVCDTWRWRRYMGEPLFQSYWLQTCRLLYRNRAMARVDRRIEMSAETKLVEVGKQATITLDIKDQSLLGQIAQGSIPVKLVTKGDRRPLETMVLSRGATPERFEGKVTMRETGEVIASVDPGVLPVDVPPVELTVEPPSREFKELTADLSSLGVLTGRTNGTVVPLPAAEKLSSAIPDRALVGVSKRSEELWSKPIALVLVVALLAAEWLLRKAAGLI